MPKTASLMDAIDEFILKHRVLIATFIGAHPHVLWPPFDDSSPEDDR